MLTKNMKYAFLLLYLIAINFTLSSQELADEIIQNSKSNFYDIQKNAESYFQKELKSANNTNEPAYDKAYHRYKRWEWYWKDRINQDGSFPDLKAKHRLFHEFTNPLKSGSTNTQSPQWLNINQKTCTGGYNGMGRTTAIAFHPTNAAVFYVGAPIGGIWKTSDGGKTYEPKGDALPHVGVGSIAINYNNPDEIYISIADNSGWWNYSLGIYKSTDAGETWQVTGLEFNFSDGVAIYTMAMSPENPNTILVATSDGLYRTVNAGRNWMKVRDNSWNDVKYRPNDESIIYAAKYSYWSKSQVYRSKDSGVTWSKLTDYSETKTKFRLAVSPANPDMLVAMSTEDKAIYISKDQGTTFKKKADAEETRFIYISPFNEDIIYHGYVSVYQSKNGGSSSDKITMWYGGTELPEIHADQHFINYNPLNGYLYFCNDGGIYRYNETNNTWKELSNGLVITQYYKIAVAQTDPVLLIGGTQDNGGRKRNNDGSWTSINGGDAMEVAIDPNDEDIFYTTYTNGEIYKTTNGWQTNTKISENIPGEPEGKWVTPYVLDPSNPSTIVAGYHEVFRSTNRGVSWTQLSTNLTGSEDNDLECIAVAPSDPNTIFACIDNTIYKTSNLGKDWRKINNWVNDQAITSIAIHPKNPDTLWVSFGGYKNDKVYQSNNGGIVWSKLSMNLPEVPVNILICDSTQTNKALYAGTDMGVFFKNDTMINWQYFGEGLPNTSVTDMDIHYDSRKLRISTYGRGIWETTLYNAEKNILPNVELISPEAELHISTGEKILLAANAFDSDGEIERVVFFNGPIKIGEVTSEPYELDLHALPAGDYSLFARAIDNRGDVSESERKSLFVECPTEGKLTGEIIGTSGTWGGNATKDKAMDGDITTFYDAENSIGAWVGLSLSDDKVIQGIRYYPRDRKSKRMVGGKFQGANNSGFTRNVTTLYEIKSAPPQEWNCLNVSLDQTFKFVRYISPNGGYANVAEVEFYGTELTTSPHFNSETEITVYPNPFTKQVTVKHQLKNISINLSNSAGIIIPCKLQNSDNSTQIIIPNNCTNGIYYLTIQSGKEVHFQKLLKVK